MQPSLQLSWQKQVGLACDAGSATVLSLYMMFVSKDSGHKQWLEAEQGGDM